VTRIAHVISEFSAHEAMGRTICETVARIPGEHHLVTTRAHDGTDRFASVHEVGGSLTTFALARSRQLATALDAVDADIVHVHGGALTAAWALAPALRRRPMVHTIYGWPRLPPPSQWRLASVEQMRRSNVLRPRVAVSTVLHPAVARVLLRASHTRSILSPDPDALARLAGGPVPVHALPSGATPQTRRAGPLAADGLGPTILFAGRAETVRGIDTLLAAFPLVRAEVPDARLRLLLIPTPELDAVLAAVEAAGLGDACEVRTAPVDDLTAALLAAQVGVWPFKFDYTTSPPAMALAEAMAVGLPVVSTTVTCVRSIADHQHNALLVAPGDHRALAANIVRVLTDRPLWHRLAAAGRHTIEHDASWDAAAAATAVAYAEAAPAAAIATDDLLVHA
jgi:glycosyltransferase involved in cell wall biosynthesis